MRSRLLLPLGLLLGGVACANALGLRPGHEAPTMCRRTDECAPGDVCHRRHCLKSCGNDDECADDEWCDGMACIPTGERCLAGAQRCDGRRPQTCGTGGRWQDSGEECAIACQRGDCVIPDSCNDVPSCGDAQVSCCTSDPVSASEFALTYESDTSGETSVERSVRPFALDRFEVVTSRFAEFVEAYASASRPSEGSGAVPGVLNSGWHEAWSDDPRLMPPNTSSLLAGIQACGSSWNAAPDIPLRCVNWYVAAAFCIWDGGRLPSEAEWMAAAIGGEEQREFPWTTPDSEEPLDQERACYRDADHVWSGPQPVGTRPLGAGRFGQHDLIGNVAEWVADMYHEELPTADCTLSVNRSAAACLKESDTALRVAKGGSFGATGARLATNYRGSDEPSRRNPLIGFRCVRELQEPRP